MVGQLRIYRPLCIDLKPDPNINVDSMIRSKSEKLFFIHLASTTHIHIAIQCYCFFIITLSKLLVAVHLFKLLYMDLDIDLPPTKGLHPIDPLMPLWRDLNAYHTV